MSVDEAANELEPMYIADRNVNGSIPVEKGIAIPQKIKHIVIIYCNISTSRYILQRNKEGIWTGIYIPTLIAALFIVTKRWKQSKCLSTDECINKMWYIHITECYSTFKRIEILTWVRSWTLKNYAMWKKPITKGQILYHSTYIKYLE